MHNRVLTVPNQLTFLRLGFLPFFIISILYGHYGWALAILFAAGISDGLDGLLARTLNQKSPLGAYLDPIADKLLMFSSYLVLAFKGRIAWWLAILVLGRDILILAACAVILASIGYMTFPPTMYGKITTTLEILLILLVIILQLVPSHWLYMARVMCGYLVAGFAVFTGFHYGVIMARRLQTHNAAQ